MRFVFLVIAVTGVCIAGGHGAIRLGGEPGHEGGTDFDINILNTFDIAFAANIRGLDYVAPDSIYFPSHAEQKIYVCHAVLATELLSFNMDPSNSSSYGIACEPGNVYVNDLEDTEIFVYNGSSWGTFSNPIGSGTLRGMDFDGTNLWAATKTSENGVSRFGTDGTFLNSWTLTEPAGFLGGIAVFPMWGGNTGVAVTCLSNEVLYFYEFDGTDLTYFGEVTIPLDVQLSLGLTYAEDRETFFWAYYNISGSGYSISELEIVDAALEQTTWGSIKSTF